MARNGSGTYSLPVNSWNPAQNGVPATAADWQALINDVASALTQSFSRDGQTTATGNFPMGGNKLTGLAAGSAAGDSLRFEQLFSQGLSTDLASAATTDIGAQLTTVVNITGTTTITSFGTNYNGPRFLRFAGVLTLTHSATLVLPGSANITTAAGDGAIVVPLGNPGTGWRVVAYQRASGEALVPPSSVPAANLTGAVAIANGGTGATTAGAALTNLGADNASNLTSGTVATARLGSGTASSTTVLFGDQSYKGIIGYGQTWQDLTASRSSGTTYTNTTGRPIFVSIEFSYANNSRNIVVDGVQISSASSTSATFTTKVGICAIVPPGSTYKSDGAAGITQWVELR